MIEIKITADNGPSALAEMQSLLFALNPPQESHRETQESVEDNTPTTTTPLVEDAQESAPEPQEIPEPKQKKRKTAKKAEPQPEPQAEEHPAEEGLAQFSEVIYAPQPEPEQPAEVKDAEPQNEQPKDEAPTVTKEQIAAEGARLLDAGKMNELLALLAEFKVQAVAQLKDDQLPEFAQRLEALGARF